MYSMIFVSKVSRKELKYKKKVLKYFTRLIVFWNNTKKW